jgi:hypothetical protein
MKYIENLLPAGYADAIEQDLTRTKFPWYYINDVTNPDYGSNSGLAHVAFEHGAQPSDWYPFIKPIIYSIEQAHGAPIKELFRIRVGFLTPTVDTENEYNTPHVDFLWPHYTACYYVNDSDGDTILFDKIVTDVGTNLTEQAIQEYTANAEFNIVGRASPKKNSACIFNGLQFHASSKPKHHDRRLVITVNYV